MVRTESDRIGPKGERPNALLRAPNNTAPAGIRLAVAAHQLIWADAEQNMWKLVDGVEVVQKLVGVADIFRAVFGQSAAQVIVSPFSLWHEVYDSYPTEMQRLRSVEHPAIVLIGTYETAGLAADDEPISALDLGVQAYVPGSRGFAHLVLAVRVAAEGYSFFPHEAFNSPRTPSDLDKVVERFLQKRRRIFTTAEGQVIRYVAAGMSSKQIADQLNISARTVETRVASTLSKLGMSSRMQLAVMIWSGADPVAQIYDQARA
ncbi:MAG: response regulator transcription factor [Chloroflexi bacterium]|nr:response regulator transcription factor [Chloroflexota bacterium]